MGKIVKDKYPELDEKDQEPRGASVRHDQVLNGATHFLTKRLPKVATEMALNVLAYNMKRMAILGVSELMDAMLA
jgi:hypothetical protein